jgi:hypothetical protein
MKSILKGLIVASLAAATLATAPILVPRIGNTVRAAMSLQTNQTCTADQLLGCVNGIVTGVNNQVQTCTAAGCAATPTGAVPVITLTCATAGGGTSAMGAGSNNDHGRVTCTSTANTTATITWATARASQPTCLIIGETTPVLTVGTNSTTALSWTYASTASPIFDYECIGN